MVSAKPLSTAALFRSTYARHGLAGFYPGGTALAFRQSSNWALRQGFTEAARERLKHSDGTPLSRGEEVAAGIAGGTLSCINQPFEVARIEAQSRAVGAQAALSMPAVMRIVLKENGLAGLYAGLIPRIGLSVWQTCFMVVAPKLVRAFVEEREVEEAVAEAAKEDLEANRG